MAARFCDRICALKGGRVVVSGRPDEILTHERLREIYGIDMDVIAAPKTGFPLAYAC